MIWETDPKAAGRLNDIAKALKGADKLILATDPDREGEAISWHVLEIMKQKRALKDQKIERVVFNAIAKQAVTEAMKNPRQIDGALVDAYLARRALDYLVGFTLSPVLWRKLPGARSAGRVQSVALRLVCDRELEIEKFVPREYWSLLATLATPRGESFEARLVGADGKKIQRLDIGSGAEAEDFKKALEAANFTVTTVEAKPARRNPQSPFTTSTLQQEASRKLGFAPAHTMRIAQRLYEGIDIGGETTGLITYMRTDGVQIDPSAITQARKVIGEDYGKAYVPDSPRQYTSKAKNAQEAHEAIRPTDLSRRPSSLKSRLDNDQARLYELIWMRTVASQMESAEMERTTVDITGKVGARVLQLRATGQVVKFDGFLAVYQEGRDDDPEDEDSKRLPVINEGEALKREGLDVSQHFTEPPPRFSEASLVKRMEELGIGRPTYCSARRSDGWTSRRPPACSAKRGAFSGWLDRSWPCATTTTHSAPGCGELRSSWSPVGYDRGPAARVGSWTRTSLFRLAESPTAVRHTAACPRLPRRAAVTITSPHVRPRHTGASYVRQCPRAPSRQCRGHPAGHRHPPLALPPAPPRRGRHRSQRELPGALLRPRLRRPGRAGGPHPRRGLRLAGHGNIAVVFGLIWIAWLNGTLFYELHGREDGHTRSLIFVQMLLLSLMAVYVGHADGDDGRTLAALYALLLALLVPSGTP
ncbi:DNA topoisomerase 1 [Streptomyces griseus subsp. griseus]